MTGHLFSLKAKAAPSSELNLDIEARLMAPLLAHVGSLFAGHIAALVLCAFAMMRIGGVWLGAIMAANVAVLAARAWVMHRIRRMSASQDPRDLLRCRTPYQVVGIAWCSIGAALCGICIAAGDETMRLLGMLLILGTASGIAARGASAPHFAVFQIMLWLLPVGTMIPLIGSGGWMVLLCTAIYFVALRSIVWRHHAERMAMIDAERVSRQTHKTLADRKAALRAVFDNAAAGVTETDLGTQRFVRVNRVFCDMLGRSEAELLGEVTPMSFTHPDDLARQREQWADIGRTGRSFHCERRYIRADGTIVWAHLCVSVAASGPDGRPQRLVTIFQDITERKAAEVALQASQELLVLSLEIGQVGTFRRDYAQGLIHCGRETRLMNGLPLDDAPIPAASWLATVVPEDVPRFLKEAAAAHAERRPIVAFEYRFLHPEKGIRFAETRSRVDYDSSGRATTSVGVVIDVTDRRRTESRLVHLAHHDPLTDLPNRSLFRIRLDQVLDQAKRGAPFAILCLDLDHFKDVNDTYGHPAGDSLLQAVAKRLQDACRPSDTVARLGGDEFAIILSPLRHPAAATAFAERIASVLDAPYDIDGHRVAIGTSIGIAIAPDDGLDPDRLLGNADMALYGAKGAGRGCHRFFEPAMQQRIQARRALDEDLRQALADGALDLYYQPLVSIATHRIRGFEALIRWRHPERGLIMPDAFIPLAESNGLIVPIGAFVLHRACAQASLWPNGVTVAVNLSASEFASPDLFDTIATALRQSGLDPRRLELEITETTMLQDTEATTAVLHKLKALGLKLSIDDFGTGFSSLGYLQRFPFDKVKIDRSFVSPLGRTRESLAIVGAVVNLCAGLDMETTAEGVETEAQLAILASLGCTEAQGYYFSRPRPGDEIPGLIAQLDLAARERYSDTLAPFVATGADEGVRPLESLTA